MQKPIAHKQTLFDFALQYCGTAEAALQIAVANNISLTAELAVGTILTIPDDVPTDPVITNYYNTKNIVPATRVTTGYSDRGGIDFMSIGGTFIVS